MSVNPVEEFGNVSSGRMARRVEELPEAAQDLAAHLQAVGESSNDVGHQLRNGVAHWRTSRMRAWATR